MPPAATGRRPRFAGVVLALGGIVAVLGACASGRSGELEPRYVAVHNTLAAMGLAQVGPLHQGSLGEGKEARIKLELATQCTTIVGLGSAPVRDLDLELLDAEGRTLAKDTSEDPQAAMRACVESRGTYTLVVRMKRGAGDFVVATWSGSIGGDATLAGAATSAQGAGTCESPLAIVPGVTSGSTSRGESEHQGSCGSTDSREIVYKLELTKKQRVTIEVDPRFDAVLYVRRDECAETEAEVACNDDAGGGKSGRSSNVRPSRIDEMLDPGTYYVFVDGYGTEAGAFRMKVDLTDVPTLAELCGRARSLAAQVPVSGGTAGSFDHVNAQCAEDAKGPDTVYKLDVAQRSRVRITEHSDDFKPVVHVRKACADEKSEIGCRDTGAVDEEATFTAVLDPGTYGVFADTGEKDADGHFTLTVDMAPEHGSGVAGDACGDAQPLPPDPVVEGDTFAARDDFSGKCGGKGAPDVVYKVDVPRRARARAKLVNQEGNHLLALYRTCGDASTELACAAPETRGAARELDLVVAPGSYYLVVDGVDPHQLGRFAIEWRTQDITAQETACKAAPLLAEGGSTRGTTSGPHRFNLSCAGREDTQAAPDRIHRFELRARAKVRLALTTQGWDGALAIRRACIDPPHATSARASEAGCARTDASRKARVEATLDAGTYYAIVGGLGANAQGPFTLDYKVER